MKYEKKFWRCAHCGNVISYLHDTGVKVMCCGEPMKELAPNTTDGAQEKHVPAGAREGGLLKVSIGKILHPSTPEHHIEWIAVVQGERVTRVTLSPEGPPQADFTVGEGPVTVYEYCNLHGLWTADL